MTEKMPHSCEICGVDGLTEEEIRHHVMLYHLKDAVICPFCHLSSLNAEEMLIHVNGAHLDYMTPEQETLTYIDDDELTLRADEFDEAGGGQSPLTDVWLSKKLGQGTSSNNNNNNNNNNVRSWEEDDKKSNGESTSWSSPQRKQLALNLCSNLAASTSLPAKVHQCLLCPYKAESADLLEEHINRKHFDLTSPSIATAATGSSPSRPSQCHLYSCPICAKTYENTPDLELHVNIEHKEILSPVRPSAGASRDPNVNECPICCMTGFKATEELAHHIEEHFNPLVSSPLTPDVSCDRLLAKEMEKRDKEVQRLREQHEFELLRAQYGMDNEGNFKDQSLANMQRAVYSGELTVADYYERQIELRMAESSGLDDGSSCTKCVVEHVAAVSSSSSNVARTYLCTTVDHYASTYGDRGWGCGYRNTQMMMSSLFHHTGFNEQLYKLWMLGPSHRPGGELPSRSTMPSISRLQQHIEWAWKQGFDTQGAEQLDHKVVNTRKWIGATEVVTVLSSLRIRCRLVDFHRPTHDNGSHPELFKWVVDYFTALDDFKPPLYLQHQGHSRTIIGVELLRDGGEYLLLLDPIHTPSQMASLKNTATAHNALRLLRKPLFAMKARQYQIVAVAGIMDSEVEYQNSKILRSDRIPPKP